MAPDEKPSPPTTAVQSADAAPSSAVKPLPPPRRPPTPEQQAARLRVFDGVLVAAVLLFAFLVSLFPARNSDFFLHAATGRLIAQGQYHFGDDPFAYTTQGAYWVNHSWLFDLIVYLLYAGSAAGGPILVVLKALMIVALAEVMLRAARVPGRRLWVPVCCVGLAVLALSPRVLLTPATVSLLFLGVTYWLLLLPRQARVRAAEANRPPPARPFLPLWFIPPLCLLWVNLDAWFLLGPATIALFLAGETLQDVLAPAKGWDEWKSRERRTLLLVLAASVAACLVNPHHVRAFTAPAQLGLSEPAGILAADDQFKSLFFSPLEGYYFYPQIGLSVAGLAFFPLALLGAASFAAAQWVGRWHWGRALLWVALLALSVWHASAVPFFAVVAGPVASLNFLDFAAECKGAKAPSAGWAWGGRVLTLAAAVLLMVLAWPGWLQATPQEQRRVGWTVEPDPALRRAAEQVASWRRDGLLGDGARWFNTAPVVLPYLAWYAPGERGFIDHVRLDLYDDPAARDFLQLRKAMASARESDAAKPDPNVWRNLLRQRDTHFLVWYDPSPVPPRSSSPLRTLLSNPDEWEPLYLDGQAAVFGWRDPSKAGGPDPFARLAAPPERLAFGPAAVPAPPDPNPPAPREWWAALWAPEAPRPPEADEAAVRLERFADLEPVWHERNAAKWDALWEERKQFLLTVGAAACFGSAAPWAGPAEVMGVRGVAGMLSEKAPMPSSPPRAGEELQYAQARQLFDFGPPAELYLAVRAARRALAVKPDDPRTYLSLAQAYAWLPDQTREGPRAGTLGYAPGYAPFPVVLRRVQAVTALRHVLDLDPNNAQAEYLAYNLYFEAGYLDVALAHADAFLRIAQEFALPEQTVKAVAEEAERLRKDVQQKQDTYLLKTANKLLPDKVETALQMGLVQAALDELQKVDWNSYDDKDPNKPRLGERELSLMVLTGHGDEVAEELKNDVDKLKDALGVDPDVGLPAYEWLRVEVAASRGEYAEADHWMGEMEAKMAAEAPLLAVLPALQVIGPNGAGLDHPDNASLTGLLVGNLLLRRAPSATGPWLPLPLVDERFLFWQTNDLIAYPVGRQADAEAARGWLALEAGDPSAARAHFEAAQSRAPGDEIPYRGRPLTDLGMELLDSGK